MKSKSSSYIKFISQSARSHYLVTGVNKNSNQDRIEQMQIRKIEMEKNTVQEPETIKRDKLVEMLQNKTALFFTALKDEKHSPKIDETNIEYWKFGAELNTYKSKDKIFVRTDANEIEEDNLGELPEFTTLYKIFQNLIN